MADNQGPSLRVGLVGDLNNDPKAQAKQITAEIRALNAEITKYVSLQKQVPADITSRMAHLQDLKRDNFEWQKTIKETKDVQGEFRKTMKEFGKEAGFSIGSERKSWKALEKVPIALLLGGGLDTRQIANAAAFLIADKYMPQLVTGVANQYQKAASGWGGRDVGAIFAGGFLGKNIEKIFPNVSWGAKAWKSKEAVEAAAVRKGFLKTFFMTLGWDAARSNAALSDPGVMKDMNAELKTKMKVVTAKFGPAAAASRAMWISYASMGAGIAAMIGLTVAEGLYDDWRNSEKFKKEVAQQVALKAMDPSYGGALMRASKDNFSGRFFGFANEDQGKRRMETARTLMEALSEGNYAQQQIMADVLGPALAGELEEKVRVAIEKRERDFPVSAKMREQIRDSILEENREDITNPYLKELKKAREEGNGQKVALEILYKEQERFRAFFKKEGMTPEQIANVMPNVQALLDRINLGISPFDKVYNLSFEELCKKLKEAGTKEAVDIELYKTMLEKMTKAQAQNIIDMQEGPAPVPDNRYLRNMVTKKQYDEVLVAAEPDDPNFVGGIWDD